MVGGAATATTRRGFWMGRTCCGSLWWNWNRMGPPVDSVQLVYKWLNSMVSTLYGFILMVPSGKLT